jgi:AhpD family alkylhydroperoxidase
MSAQEQTLDAQLAQIKKELPQLANAFNAFFMQVMKDGALTGKTKELIALGIALAQRCEPCIQIHVKKCLAAGCTKEEILEGAGVAVVMQGGPAYTHLPTVLEALK